MEFGLGRLEAEMIGLEHEVSGEETLLGLLHSVLGGLLRGKGGGGGEREHEVSSKETLLSRGGRGEGEEEG